jgi:hypothetical protein
MAKATSIAMKLTSVERAQLISACLGLSVIMTSLLTLIGDVVGPWFGEW